MATQYKNKPQSFTDGEWDAITAPFLQFLEDKDPDFIQGFLNGIAYRFQTQPK
jgi:hypothetical protein